MTDEQILDKRLSTGLREPLELFEILSQIGGIEADARRTLDACAQRRIEIRGMLRMRFSMLAELEKSK